MSQHATLSRTLAPLTEDTVGQTAVCVCVRIGQEASEPLGHSSVCLFLVPSHYNWANPKA